MPDVPGEAVRLALIAYARALYDRPDPMVLSDESLMRIVLEAAAPAMAEHVAAKITAHKYAHEPKGPLIGGKTSEDQRRRTWRRHFGIASRIAARAFMTDDDLKRAAAEALNRGDFAACYLDEAGNPVAGQREDGKRD